MDTQSSALSRVSDIHDKLKLYEGKRIKARANMGRSRIVERMGTLVAVHPSVFVIETEERRGRTERQSYQYVDVLTGTVELFDGDSGERLFEYTMEEY